MNCYVNDQVIPCDIFLTQYGWFLIVPFFFNWHIVVTKTRMDY